jgi:type I restriction enzyme R subunit
VALRQTRRLDCWTAFVRASQIPKQCCRLRVWKWYRQFEFTSLRKDKGTDEGKVFNLVRGLQKEIDDNSNIAAVLLPLKERAERVIKDLEDRKITGLAAMDLLSAIAVEKENTKASAADSGLSPKAFAVLWMLRGDTALRSTGIDAKQIAVETEALMARFPNASVNADEQRRLRAGLYRPLLALSKEDRSRVVDQIIATIFN